MTETASGTRTDQAVDRYLDLTAKMLTRYGFEGRTKNVGFPRRSYESYLWTLLLRAVKGRDIRLAEPGEFGPKQAARREEGRDWPADAETMIGLKRLANIRSCLERVLADGVPGDFVETGVWRGGGSIYARAVLAAHGVEDRTVWLADSFQGLPKADGRFDADSGDQLHAFAELAVTRETVEENFRRYDLLDDQVRFIEGWFSETLPTAPIDRVAVLRLDGDMYSSTMDALEALYDKVPVGGFVIIDDYALEICAQAIHDFRDARGITDPIEKIDWTGAFWRRS